MGNKAKSERRTVPSIVIIGNILLLKPLRTFSLSSKKAYKLLKISFFWLFFSGFFGFVFYFNSWFQFINYFIFISIMLRNFTVKNIFSKRSYCFKLFVLWSKFSIYHFFISLIFSISFFSSSFSWPSRIPSLIVDCWAFQASSCFLPLSSVVFVCFSKDFSKEEWMNL